MIFGQTSTRTYFELQPVIPLGGQVQACALVAAVLVMAAWSIWLYRKDSVDLSRPAAFLLTTLRLVSIATLVVFVLNPGKRSETRLTKNSRLLMLIDDSLSMGLEDRDRLSADSAAGPGQRMDEVKKLLAPELTASLRQTHELAIYRFGEFDQPELLVELPRVTSAPIVVEDHFTRDVQEGWELRIASWLVGLALAIFGCALSLVVSAFLRRRGQKPNGGALGSWRFAIGVLLWVAGVVVMSAGDLVLPQRDLFDGFGNGLASTQPPVKERLGQLGALPEETASMSSGARDSMVGLPAESQWLEELAPRGTSTKIGAAIEAIVNQERGGPIAGVVLFSDGQSNSGLPVERAAAVASNAGIPVYTVGIGSARQPRNAQVADLQAPARVFPGDEFQVRGVIKAFGLEGQTARVQLFSVDPAGSAAEILEEETSIRLKPDGEAAGVEFSVVRDQEGKRQYEMRVESFEDDLDQRDNRRRCEVEVIRQKTNVLLIAGGPTREFRFLRNQLHRDEEIFLNVWLQSAEPGADQESDVLLDSFPRTAQALYEIDCIIAFDPDWQRIDTEQMRLLEQWISEQAGGLITVAGPVNTPQWTRQPRGDEKIDLIRRIYPVSFYNQGSAVLKLGRFGGTTPFPLAFTRVGRSADYLWIGDSAGSSQETWARFEGVFGYYAVNEPKPGADVLANFGDPETAIDESYPIYLASQFYGAGRVFFQASGEMWRVRRMDVEYFQQYYSKLIRWASQGRLNRDSTRGVLLTDRQRCWLGDTVAVQAILKNAQGQPLDYPEIQATVRTPAGVNRTIALRSNPAAASPGSFTGSFVADSDGQFKVMVAIPESPDLDVLLTSVTATIPDLEKENPQRNDAVLSKIAEKTGGQYVFHPDMEVESPVHPLSALQTIAPQDQETIIAGTFDRFFKRRLMMWVLGLMTLCLCLEWLLRRLQKLA